jgi:hypothetical protein
VGWESIVGAAPQYRLDGAGIISVGGMRFSVPIQTNPGAHPESYTMGTRSFLGHGIDNPPPGVKKEHSYTSPSPLDLCVLFYGELTFTYLPTEQDRAQQ